MTAAPKFPLADLFCGAGGTSTGAVEALTALGYTPELTAINHWEVAVATHRLNHPAARHLCESVDHIKPRDLFRRGELRLLWASPECTHHSIARGGAPVNDQSRATAWCVTRFAEALLPETILVENVPEFRTWGPIGANGQPLKSRRGETFGAWLNVLRALGYTVDWKIFCAADYGDPTTRRRLFVQAQRGRRKIVWAEPTHAADGEAGLFGHRQRWRPARDIIDWNLQGASIFNRQRPLALTTLKRIEAGLVKFGLRPFIVPQQSRPEPRGVDVPAPTVVTKGSGIRLAQPYIVSWDQTSGSGKSSIDAPLTTVCTKARHGVAQPYLVKLKGTRPSHIKSSGADLDEPVATIHANGNHLALAEPFLLPHEGIHRGNQPRSLDKPMPTVTASHGGGALVTPFLISFYGTGHPLTVSRPLGTICCKDRFGLVRPQVLINGKNYLLDIHFRMLQPHELAAAQGFRRDYKFSGNKTEQVKQIGNAVPRRLARALVAAAVSQNADVSFLTTQD